MEDWLAKANAELAEREKELRRRSLDPIFSQPSTAAVGLEPATPRAAAPDPIFSQPSRAAEALAVRPMVDESTLDANDARARTTPAPLTPMQKADMVRRSGAITRFLEQGPGRVTMDIGQTFAHMTPKSWGLSDRMDALRADEAKRWEDARRWAKGGEDPGWNIAAGMGEAATYAGILPQKLPFMSAPQSALGRAATNAFASGAAGAVSGVDDTENFWGQKAGQTAFAALAGGAATPLMEVGARIVGTTVKGIRDWWKGRAVTPQVIDAALDRVIAASGADSAQLSKDMRSQMRSQVEQILKTGGDLNPDQLARKAAIESVGGIPTRGSVTLDPVVVSQEKNLAKIGANSTDPALQTLSQTQNANNAALIERINRMGAEGAPETIDTGNRLIRALSRFDRMKQQSVARLYDEAKQVAEAGGSAIQFNGMDWVNKTTDSLTREMKGAFLPKEVQTVMSGVFERQKNGQMLTMGEFEQLRTVLANEARKAAQAGDGNAQRAVSIARDTLEDLDPVGVGKSAVAAFGRARAAHRARMKLIEDVPALKAVAEGVQPDKFVETFIINQGGKANVAEVAALKKAITADPEAFDMIRRTLIGHFKTKALNGSADEFGVFSGKALEREMRRVGDQKLGLFFSADEIGSLKTLVQAARAMTFQPAGSAVNNSNSGALAAAYADRLLESLANRLPIPSLGTVAATKPFTSRANAGRAAEALDPLGMMLGKPWNTGPVAAPLALGVGLTAATNPEEFLRQLKAREQQ